MTEADVLDLPDESVIRQLTNIANNAENTRNFKAFVEIRVDFDKSGARIPQPHKTAIYKLVAWVTNISNYSYVFQRIEL